jgi:hypothetical protein
MDRPVLRRPLAVERDGAYATCTPSVTSLPRICVLSVTYDLTNVVAALSGMLRQARS